jgi:uncharacterized protein YlxW (UPF0749 family)
MIRSATTKPLTLVAFILGILLVVQLRSTSRAANVALTTSDQARVLSGLVDSNAGLRQEIAQLEEQLTRLNPADTQASNQALVADLKRLMVMSGGADVSGPGVRVEVSGQINPLDMQDLLNELRNAGAEAMALDGTRIIVRSVVARDGNDLVLDGHVLIPPYTLEAIGQSDTIDTALLRKGGLVGLLEYAYPGLKITVTKVDGLILPAYTNPTVFKFAQPTQ